MKKTGDSMIPVQIVNGDLKIKNINVADLKSVLECVNQSEDSLKALGRKEEFQIEDIKERYFETLVNSLEYFLGIYKNEKLVGIIKGRLENINEPELWVLSFIIIKEYREAGMGTQVIKYIENYFMTKYSVKQINAIVMYENKRAQKFWKNNGYKLTRAADFSNEGSDGKMLIFEKKGV